MSNFFSCIVTLSAEVMFCELDAHDEIVYRSGLSDDLTHFLRVIYNYDDGYLVDSASIPEWYERKAALIGRKVTATYKKLFPVWKEYDRTCQVADARFTAIAEGAWSGFREYADRRRESRVKECVFQSDEDDIGVQDRFEEFVGIEGKARAVLESAKNVGLVKYERKASLIEGYLPKVRKEEGAGGGGVNRSLLRLVSPLLSLLALLALCQSALLVRATCSRLFVTLLLRPR